MLVQSFVSSCGRAGSFLALPKKEPKRLGTGRGVCGAPAPQIPCASRRAGVAQTVHPCTASQSRRSIAATLRAFSRRACDARHRERRRLFHGCRPSMDCVGITGLGERALAPRFALLLRQDAAKRGPCGAARTRRKSPKEGAHDACPFAACTWMYIQRTPQRPRALGAQGCAESAPPGCVSFGYLSLHKQRKVTRSPAGRVEALRF